MKSDTTALEAEILAAWRALMSPAEAERIGPTTLTLMAHEAAKSVRRKDAGATA